MGRFAERHGDDIRVFFAAFDSFARQLTRMRVDLRHNGDPYLRSVPRNLLPYLCGRDKVTPRQRSTLWQRSSPKRSRRAMTVSSRRSTKSTSAFWSELRSES